MKNKLNFRTGILVTTAVFALFARLNSAHAQDLYWDTNGSAAGFGNFAGAWNGTNLFWNSDPTGGAAGTLSSSTSALNKVIFAGAGNTGEVVVSGNQTVGSIDFANTGNLVALRVGTAGGPVMSLAVNGNITDSGVGFADVRVVNMNQSNAATILTANSISTGVISFAEESFSNAQFWSTGYNMTATTQFNLGRGNGNYTYTQTGGIVTVIEPTRGIAFNAGQPWSPTSSTRQHTYNLNGGELRVGRIGVNSQNDGNNNLTDIYSSNARLEFNDGTIQNVTPNGSLLFQNGLSFNTFNGTGSRDMQYNTSRPLVVALSGTGTHTINADGASSTVIVTPGAQFVDKTGENGTLRKTGLGNLIFTGGNPLAINSYTGSTTVSAGTVSTDYNRIAGIAASGGTDNLSDGYSAASQLVLDGGNYTMVGRGSATASSATGVTLAAGTSASALNVNVGSTAGLVIGQSVSNANLPAGTYIRRIIDGSTIELNAMPMQTTAQTGQTLNFGAATFNNTQTINDVSLLQNATVTVTPGAGTSTTLLSFGNVAGSGGLTKAGAGTLKLTGDITHSGTIAINAGTLEFASEGNKTIIAPLTGTVAGTFVKSGAGTLTMDSIPANGRHEFFGAVIVNGGTLVSAEAAEGFFRASSYTVNNGSALTGLGGSAFGYGPMGSLTVNAGGTFQTGFQEMGNVTLNGGTINLNPAGSFGGNSIALSRDVTVGGSSASIFQGSSRLALNIAGNPAGQTRAFNVADATGNSSADLIISSVVHNAHVANGTPGGNLTNLEKKGAGTMQLSGNNTYSGSTIVSAGTLLISGTGSINSTSEILVSAGATFQYNSTTALTKDLNLGSGAALGGSGVVGNVNLASGSLLKPGNSPGLLTASAATWAAGSTYQWEIDNATGTAGTNWDVFSVTGALDLSALSSSGQMNLVLQSLSIDNYSTTTPFSWTIAKAGSLIGDGLTDGADVTALFNINATAFNSGDLPTNGFKVEVGTTEGLRTLNLMAIPEPSTGSLMTLGLGGLVLTRLLRRKVS